MISATQFARYASDPAAFIAELQIDADGQARRFAEVMDPWQVRDFEALLPGLQRCNGRGDNPDAKMRVFLERPRGHSKTSDIAVACVWALAFAARPVKGFAFAADQDQAGILKEAMQTIIRLNPWLSSVLEIQRNLVVNVAKGHPGKGSKLEIFASDVASSYGILPDLVVADELCHWEGDGSLWHSIISSAAKRSNCLLLTISNAGFVDSWQWHVREQARIDPAGWHFSRLDGPVASWLTPARLEEQKRMLPGIAYARLWENQWSSGGGDALTREDIAFAFAEGRPPMDGRDVGWRFVAGCDLGLTRDASAVVVLAVPEGGLAGKIRLAAAKRWLPLPGGKVNIAEVEEHILSLDRRFGLEAVAYDVWQAEHLAQRLEAMSKHRRRDAWLSPNNRRLSNLPWLRAVPPTGANLRAQASVVIESFQDRRLQLFDDNLRRDLEKLRVEEKSYGLRLASPRDGEGHGDLYSAFALALRSP